MRFVYGVNFYCFVELFIGINFTGCPELFYVKMGLKIITTHVNQSQVNDFSYFNVQDQLFWDTFIFVRIIDEKWMDTVNVNCGVPSSKFNFLYVLVLYRSFVKLFNIRKKKHLRIYIRIILEFNIPNECEKPFAIIKIFKCRLYYLISKML